MMVLLLAFILLISMLAAYIYLPRNKYHEIKRWNKAMGGLRNSVRSRDEKVKRSYKLRDKPNTNTL